MRVRDAGERDAAAVGPLLDELGYPAPLEAVAARLARLDADGGSRVLVAEDGDGLLVGLVATHLIPRLNGDRPACKVIAMVVAARAQGAGVGRALMTAAEDAARAAGAERMELSSGDWRPDAHAFYTRLGFERRSSTFTKALAVLPQA